MRLPVPTVGSKPAESSPSVPREGIDVYNTMLQAMGASRRLGPTDREPIQIDTIRA